MPVFRLKDLPELVFLIPGRWTKYLLIRGRRVIGEGIGGLTLKLD